VHPQSCGLRHPGIKPIVGVSNVVELSDEWREEVVFHVLDAALDLALLLRLIRRRRVDLDAVVARELAVAAVQRGLAIDAERSANHSSLQVVGTDHARSAAKRRKCLDMQP
jgi:hypothetical protein